MTFTCGYFLHIRHEFLLKDHLQRTQDAERNCSRCSFFCVISEYLGFHCLKFGKFAFIIIVETQREIFALDIYM